MGRHLNPTRACTMNGMDDDLIHVAEVTVMGSAASASVHQQQYWAQKDIIIDDRNL